jgi:hypothetical protein
MRPLFVASAVAWVVEIPLTPETSVRTGAFTRHKWRRLQGSLYESRSERGSRVKRLQEVKHQRLFVFRCGECQA